MHKDNVSVCEQPDYNEVFSKQDLLQEHQESHVDRTETDPHTGRSEQTSLKINLPSLPDFDNFEDTIDDLDYLAGTEDFDPILAGGRHPVPEITFGVRTGTPKMLSDRLMMGLSRGAVDMSSLETIGAQWNQHEYLCDELSCTNLWTSRHSESYSSHSNTRGTDSHEDFREDVDKMMKATGKTSPVFSDSSMPPLSWEDAFYDRHNHNSSRSDHGALATGVSSRGKNTTCSHDATGARMAASNPENSVLNLWGPDAILKYHRGTYINHIQDIVSDQRSSISNRTRGSKRDGTHGTASTRSEWDPDINNLKDFTGSPTTSWGHSHVSDEDTWWPISDYDMSPQQSPAKALQKPILHNHNGEDQRTSLNMQSNKEFIAESLSMHPVDATSEPKLVTNPIGISLIEPALTKNPTVASSRKAQSHNKTRRWRTVRIHLKVFLFLRYLRRPLSPALTMSEIMGTAFIEPALKSNPTVDSSRKIQDHDKIRRQRKLRGCLKALLFLQYLRRPLSPALAISDDIVVMNANGCVEGEPTQVVVANKIDCVGDYHFQVNNRRASLTKIQEALTTLAVSVGLLEPPLRPGWFRLRWRCRCGDSFFSDVVEYRKGGINRVIQRMEYAIGAEVTVAAHSNGSRAQNWSFKMPAWTRAFSSGSNSGSQKPPKLPQNNSPNPKSTSTGSTTSTIAIDSPIRLLACIHRTHQSMSLLQEPIDEVKNDLSLFLYIQEQVRRHRGRLRQMFSLRSVQGIHFVKVHLRTGGLVEVREHSRYCASVQPASPTNRPIPCDCIPPEPKREPAPNAEYRCTIDDLDMGAGPPVDPKFLLHMLNSTSCITPDSKSIFNILPRRICGELKGGNLKPTVGWGVYYQEGLNADMVVTVMFSVFLLSSLLFGVLWSALKMDIQGAFGVSSYMMTASGIVIAWIATRAKNYD